MSDAQPQAAFRRQNPILWSLVLPAAIVLLLYAATFLLLPRTGVWINDNGCRFIQMLGLIRSGSAAYDIPWPGATLDPAFIYNPLPDPFGHVIDGKLYAQYSPLFALIASLFYRLLGDDGIYVLPFAGGILTLPAVWCLAGQLTESRLARATAVLLVGLATPMWFYAMTFWELATAACLTTWSLALLLGALDSGRAARLWPAAILCGLAIAFRDVLYILAGVMTLAVFLNSRPRWRGTVIFASTLVVTLIPIWWFQWQSLGHPLGLHFSAHGPMEFGVSHYLAGRWTTFRQLFVDSHEGLAASLFLSTPAVLLMFWCPRLSRGTLSRLVPTLAAIAGLAGAVILVGHLTAEYPVWWLRRSKSLFAASPVLILAFVRLKQTRVKDGHEAANRRRESARKMLWLIFLAYGLLYALAAPSFTTAGIHWGCRYLMPAYPMLATLAAVTLAQWWRRRPGQWRLAMAPIAIALAMSVVMQVYSLGLLHQRKAFSAALNQIVADRGEEVIIARGFFMPPELFRNFYDKPIFLLSERQRIRPLMTALAGAGYRRALYVGDRPCEAGTLRDRTILSDGLGFLTVELRPLALTTTP